MCWNISATTCCRPTRDYSRLRVIIRQNITVWVSDARCMQWTERKEGESEREREGTPTQQSQAVLMKRWPQQGACLYTKKTTKHAALTQGQQQGRKEGTVPTAASVQRVCSSSSPAAVGKCSPEAATRAASIRYLYPFQLSVAGTPRFHTWNTTRIGLCGGLRGSKHATYLQLTETVGARRSYCGVDPHGVHSGAVTSLLKVRR